MTDTLRKLAEDATPGPWHPGHLGRKDHSCNCTSIVDESYAGGIARVNVWNGIKSIAEGGNDAPPEEEAAANMQFIAAANPTAVIALLDEIDALRAKVKAQGEALAPFAALAESVADIDVTNAKLNPHFRGMVLAMRRAAQEAGNEI